MITELEIIDTAVKVGLGALVSAVTTYCITRRTHRHEMQTSLVRDKRELLRESALKLEKSSSMINVVNAAVFHLQQADIAPEGASLNNILNDLTSAFNEAKEARALCYMMGDEILGNLIAQYLDSVEELNNYYHTNRLETDVAYIDANTDKRTETRNRILNRLGAAHKAIYFSSLRTTNTAPRGILRLGIVGSGFWIIASIILYFSGIWFYPSFVTTRLSHLYLWIDHGPVIEYGVGLAPHYPLVDFGKLLLFTCLPLLVAWLVLFIGPHSILWVRNGLRHKVEGGAT